MPDTPEALYGAEDGSSSRNLYQADYGGYSNSYADGGWKPRGSSVLNRDEEEFSYATGRAAAIQEYERSRARLTAAGIDPDMRQFQPQEPWWSKGLRTMSGLGVLVDWAMGDAVLRTAIGGGMVEGAAIDKYAGALGKHAPTGKELLLKWGLMDQSKDEEGRIDAIDMLGLGLEILASPSAWVSLGTSAAMSSSLKGGTQLLRSTSDDILRKVGTRVGEEFASSPTLLDDIAKTLGKDRTYVERLVSRATSERALAEDGTLSLLNVVDRLGALEELEQAGFLRNLGDGRQLLDEVSVARSGLLPSAEELAHMIGAEDIDAPTKRVMKALGDATDEAYETSKAFTELQRRAAESMGDLGGIKVGLPFHQYSKTGKGAVSVISGRRINEIANKVGLGEDFVEAWRRSLPGRAMYRTFVSDWRLKKLGATDKMLETQLVNLKRVGQARMDNEMHTHINALIGALKELPKKADRIDLLRVMETPGEVTAELKRVFNDSGVVAFLDAADYIKTYGGFESVAELLQHGRDKDLLTWVNESLPEDLAGTFSRAIGDTMEGDGARLAFSIHDEYAKLNEILAKYRRRVVADGLGVDKMPKRYDETGAPVALRSLIDNEADAIDEFDELVHEAVLTHANADELNTYRDSVARLFQLHEEYSFFRVPEEFSAEGLTQGQLARAAELFAKRSEDLDPQERGRLVQGLVAEIAGLRSHYEDIVGTVGSALEDTYRALGNEAPPVHAEQVTDAMDPASYFQFGVEMQQLDPEMKAIKRRIDSASIELMEIMRAPTSDPKVADAVTRQALSALSETVQGRVRRVWRKDPRNLFVSAYDVVGSLETANDDTLRFMLEANAGIDDAPRLYDEADIDSFRANVDANPDARLTYAEAQKWTGDSSIRRIYYIEADPKLAHGAPMFTAQKDELPIPTLKVHTSPIHPEGAGLVPVAIRTKRTAVIDTLAIGTKKGLQPRSKVTLMTAKGPKSVRLVDLADMGFDSFIVKDSRELHLLPAPDDFHSVMSADYATWGKGVPRGFRDELAAPSRRPMMLAWEDPDTGEVMRKTYAGNEAEGFRGKAASTLRKRIREASQTPPGVSTQFHDFDGYVPTVRMLDVDPDALPDMNRAIETYAKQVAEPEAFITPLEEWPADGAPLSRRVVSATDVARSAEKAWKGRTEAYVFTPGNGGYWMDLAESDPSYAAELKRQVHLSDGQEDLDLFKSGDRYFEDRKNHTAFRVRTRAGNAVSPKVRRGDVGAVWPVLDNPEESVHIRQWNKRVLHVTSKGVGLSEDTRRQVIADALASGAVEVGDTMRFVDETPGLESVNLDVIVTPDMVKGGRNVPGYGAVRTALYHPETNTLVPATHPMMSHDEMIDAINGQAEDGWSRPLLAPLKEQAEAEAAERATRDIAAMSDEEALAKLNEIDFMTWDETDDFREALDYKLKDVYLEERLAALSNEAIDDPDFVPVPPRHVIHGIVGDGAVTDSGYHAVIQASNKAVKEGAEAVVHIPNTTGGRVISARLKGIGYANTDTTNDWIDMALDVAEWERFRAANPDAVKTGRILADLNDYTPAYRRVFSTIDDMDDETRTLMERFLADQKELAIADKQRFEALRAGEWDVLPKDWGTEAGLPAYDDLDPAIQTAIRDLYATGDEYSALRHLNTEEAMLARQYVDGQEALQRQVGHLTPLGSALPVPEGLRPAPQMLEEAQAFGSEVMSEFDLMSDEGMRTFLESDEMRSMRVMAYKFMPAEMDPKQKRVAARLVAMMDSTLKELQKRGIASEDLDAVFEARRMVQEVTLDGRKFPIAPAIAEDAVEHIEQVFSERGAWSRLAKSLGYDVSEFGEVIEKMHTTSVAFSQAVSRHEFSGMDEGARRLALQTFIGREMGLAEDVWPRIEPTEFLMQVKQYVPHMRVEDPDVPWIRRLFGLYEPAGDEVHTRVLMRPISTKMENVQMERTIRGSIDAINKMVGKEMFHEDPAKAISLYIQRAVKATTSYDMLDSLVRLRDSFGHSVVSPARWDSEAAEWVAPKGYKVFQLKEMNLLGRNVEKLLAIYGDELDETGVAMLRATHKEHGRLGLMAREEVVDEFESAIKAFTNDAQMNEYLKSWDKVLGVIKTHQTVVRPGFHVRNFISNIWLNLYAGVKNPAHYSLAMDVQLTGRKVEQFVMDELMRPLESGGPRIWNMDDAWREMVDRGMIEAKSVNLGGHDMTYGELFRLSKDHGILGTGRIGSDIHVFTEQQLARLKPANTIFNPLSQAWGPTRLGRDVGSAIENNARMAHFVSMLDSTGGDAGAAAWSVRKYLFDYNELTDIERNVIKRFGFPYWSWLRKNAELQVDTLIHRPFLITWPVKTLNRITEIDTTEYKPKWLDEIGGFAIPGMKLGDFNKVANAATFGFLNLDEASEQPIYLALGLPFLDLTNMNTKDLLSATNPLVRIPAEVFSNYNVYLERPVEEFTGELVKAPNVVLGVDEAVRALGDEEAEAAWNEALSRWGVVRSELTGDLQTGAWFSYFFKQFGPSIEAYGKALPNGDADYGTLLLNFMTGVRFVPIDEEQQGYFTEKERAEAMEEGIRAQFDRGVEVPYWSELDRRTQAEVNRTVYDSTDGLEGGRRSQ